VIVGIAVMPFGVAFGILAPPPMPRRAVVLSRDPRNRWAWNLNFANLWVAEDGAPLAASSGLGLQFGVWNQRPFVAVTP